MGVSGALKKGGTRKWWHVGSRFAATNKGGCMMLVIFAVHLARQRWKQQNLAFVKLLETVTGPSEAGV
jgi:hypothetical protein